MLSALAGLSILIIGDSHLTSPNYLVTTLYDDLAKRGAQVSVHGVCGANAGDWTRSTPGSCGGAVRGRDGKLALKGSGASTTPVADLIKAEKADLVVVVMGDTMAAYDKPQFPKTWAWQQVSSLTKSIAGTGTSCIWVGPAWGSEGGKYGKTFERVKLMSSFLSANVAPCAYVDSLAMSKPGQWGSIDGQHLTSTGYARWGSAIGAEIAKLRSGKGKTK